MSDTLRPDYLGCYGNSWVKTPNIDRLADDGVLFKNAYAEGCPTGPERIVQFTGRFTIPYNRYEMRLEPEDIALPEILGRSGHFGVRSMGKEDYICGFIADTYHIFKSNLHRGFHSFQWIRGQEFDNYITDPRRNDSNVDRYLKLKDKSDSMNSQKISLQIFLRNVADFRNEDDWFPSQTMRASMRWLEGNRLYDKFFLWIDMFDPHAPYYPPDWYYEMYADPSYDGPKIIYPEFISPNASDFTDEEKQDIRALYAGEVSLVDHWVGELLNKIDALGLTDDTFLMLVSDHGHCFGEHGMMHKGNIYQEVCRVPLIMRHPTGPKGKRIEQLVWTPDCLPTLLDVLGVEAPKTIQGKSFWPLVTGEREVHREYVVSSYGHAYRRVTDLEWSYIVRRGLTRWIGGSLAPGKELYNLKKDPKEQNNLFNELSEKAEQMERRLNEFLLIKHNRVK